MRLSEIKEVRNSFSQRIAIKRQSFEHTESIAVAIAQAFFLGLGAVMAYMMFWGMVVLVS